MVTPTGKQFRNVLPVALLLLLFCCSGATCTRSFRNPFVPYGPPAPEVLAPGASLDMVIAAVNQNASRIQNYQTTNASITVPGVTALPLLRGNIAAERPGRLRLQASTSLTGPEVDLGSNDELFWFWVKRNEPQALYFSHHNQYVGSAAQQLMPIEPSWLLDALGFAQFDPHDYHEPPIPHGNGKLEIRSVLQTRIGNLTKSTVVDASRAWVLEQYIYDAQGTLLASAVARSHQYYPAANISLPQEIEIRLPVAQMALSIDVGTVVLNQPSLNPTLWQLPAISGCPQVDLGTAPPNTLSAIGPPGSNDLGTGASPLNFGIQPTSATFPADYGQPAAASNLTRPQSQFVAPTTLLPGSTPAIQAPSTPWVAPATRQAAPSAQPIQQQLPPGGVSLDSGF